MTPVHWRWGRAVALARWLVALSVLPVAAASAQGLSHSKVADGVRIEYGLAPAAWVRSHPPEHTESGMHSGPPASVRSYHLVVALFDAQSGARISAAQVEATVAPVGFVTDAKPMERMDIAGAASFGAYFDLPVEDPYIIHVHIQRADRNYATEVAFFHRHEPEP